MAITKTNDTDPIQGIWTEVGMTNNTTIRTGEEISKETEVTMEFLTTKTKAALDTIPCIYQVAAITI